MSSFDNELAGDHAGEVHASPAKMSSVNILPIIAAWVSDHTVGTEVDRVMFDQPARAEIFAWFNQKYPNPVRLNLELVADCLIAAGIGREQEQNGTVCCRCTY